MRRITKNLVVASIVGILVALATYSYKTGPQFLANTRANWFYGFPLPFYKETVIDAFGVVYQFSILNAAADFLIFFGASIAVLTALARIRITLHEAPPQITR